MFHRCERLFLRPAWPEDWQKVFGGIADEGVVRNLASAPWPYSEADARAFTQREGDPFLPSLIAMLPVADGEELVGGAGLGLSEDGQVQLGYWVARRHWGKGFATEAARGVLEIARMLGHPRLVAAHYLDNPASGRVLEKLGFAPTGAIREHACLARRSAVPAAEYELVFSGTGTMGEPKRAA